MALTKTEVSKLYVAIFNRASEGEGNTYWQNTGLSMGDTATEMLNTDDAKTYFGTSLDTDQAFIEHIYQNTLNKTATDDPDGISYWVKQLESGKSKGEVVSALVNAVGEYKDSTDAKTKAAYDQFTDRVTVSDYTAEHLQKAPTNYKNDLGFDANLTVTNDASTVTSAENAVDSLATHAIAKLTSGQDTIVGTSSDDLITGAIGTWTSNDSIKDSSTTDNDELQVEINSNISNTLKVENIEKISVNTLTAKAINGANITGAKEINNASSTGVLTVNNASLDVDYVVTSSVGGITLGFDAGSVNGGTDKVGMSLTGMGNATITTGAGVETLAIDLDADAGLNNIVTAATTLQFTGGKAFTLNAANSITNTVTTIDARGAGTFTAGVTQNANGTAILTGSGDDIITTAGVITANDVFSLGSGNNTLVTTVAGTGAQAVYQNVSNITSKVAADIFDMANSTSATAFTFEGGGNVTAINMASGSTISTTKLAAANTTVGMKASVMGEAFNLDVQAGLAGTVTATNINDLTITLAGAGTALGTVTLDDIATATNGMEVVEKFTLVANTATTAGANIVTASGSGNAASDLKEIKIDANAAVTLGTIDDITKLETLTINANSAGAVSVGNIGATDASTALNTITMNGASSAITVGTIGVANAAGISAINIDTTGGAFTGGLLTNTGGNIDTITATGSNNVTQNYTVTSGNVDKVDATGLTGALTTTITNAGTANADGTAAGSTITLGNVVSGSTNAITMAGTNVANTITGGTGVDTIISVGGKDTIDGGAGNDIITGGGNADTITGGAGVDTFNFSPDANNGTGALLGANTTAALIAESHDVITDYSGTSRGDNDVITNTLGNFLVEASGGNAAAGTAVISANGLASFDAADNTLAEQITAVAAAIELTTGATAGEAAVWVNGANTYLFISDGVAGVTGNDIVVELTGIAATTGIDATANGTANISDIA